MTAAKKDDYHSGHDIKSLGINVASLFLFFLPIACYLFRSVCREMCLATLASFVVAYLLPPVGWKRPHPYSDMPDNVPWPKKSE